MISFLILGYFLIKSCNSPEIWAHILFMLCGFLNSDCSIRSPDKCSFSHSNLGLSLMNTGFHFQDTIRSINSAPVFLVLFLHCNHLVHAHLFVPQNLVRMHGVPTVSGRLPTVSQLVSHMGGLQQLSHCWECPIQPRALQEQMLLGRFPDALWFGFRSRGGGASSELKLSPSLATSSKSLPSQSRRRVDAPMSVYLWGREQPRFDMVCPKMAPESRREASSPARCSPRIFEPAGRPRLRTAWKRGWGTSEHQRGHLRVAFLHSSVSWFFCFSLSFSSQFGNSDFVIPLLGVFRLFVIKISS